MPRSVAVTLRRRPPIQFGYEYVKNCINAIRAIVVDTPVISAEMKILFRRRDDHFFAEVITNEAFARLSALWEAVMTTGSYSAEQVDAADKAPRVSGNEPLAGVYSDLSPNGDYDGRSVDLVRRIVKDIDVPHYSIGYKDNSDHTYIVYWIAPRSTLASLVADVGVPSAEGLLLDVNESFYIITKRTFVTSRTKTIFAERGPVVLAPGRESSLNRAISVFSYFYDGDMDKAYDIGARSGPRLLSEGTAGCELEMPSKSTSSLATLAAMPCSVAVILCRRPPIRFGYAYVDHFFAEVNTNDTFARLSALWGAVMTTGSYSTEQVEAR